MILLDVYSNFLQGTGSEIINKIIFILDPKWKTNMTNAIREPGWEVPTRLRKKNYKR
jgi:hypothetical protein